MREAREKEKGRILDPDCGFPEPDEKWRKKERDRERERKRVGEWKTIQIGREGKLLMFKQCMANEYMNVYVM